MTTEITKPSDAELTMAVSGVDNFVPNLMLTHPQSETATKDICKPGHYCWNQERDLGKEVKIIILARRFHAVLIKNSVKIHETFDASSPIAKEIMETPRDVPKSDPRRGYSWLCFLPEHNVFGVFHPNTPSARPVSMVFVNCMLPPDERDSEAAKQQPYTRCFMLSHIIRDKPQTHFVPVAVPAELDASDMPTKELMKKNHAIFVKPIMQEPKREVATEETASER